jgi:hypothetical protein
VSKSLVYLGCGIARGPYTAQKQDSFYMTQNFSDTIAAASEEKARQQLQPASTRAMR